jgi:hypothetical protein
MVSKPYLKCSDTSHFTLQNLQGFFASFAVSGVHYMPKYFLEIVGAMSIGPLMFGGRILTKL